MRLLLKFLFVISTWHLSTAQNIYTTNGTLSANRHVSLNSKHLIFSASPTSTIVMRSNGSLGIGGFPDPSQKLSVFGNAKFSGGVALGGLSPSGIPLIAIQQSGTNQIAQFYNTIGSTRFEIGIEANNGGYLRFLSDGSLTKALIRADGITYFNGGRVGIGTSNPDPTKLLSVNGEVLAKEYEATLLGWSDYVFDTNYRLLPLEQLNHFIKEHKHLPNIPTEAEVLQNGVKLGEMNAKLLAKIEELTLHMIKLNERINELEKGSE